MRRYWVPSLLIFILLLAGCGTSAPAESSSIGSSTSGATPKPLMVTNGTLTLLIFAPQNGEVVTETPVEILGSVSSDSTLSLQGETHILPPGDFTLMTDLEPGVNELYFNVSSLLGNQVELTLVVTYEP